MKLLNVLLLSLATASLMLAATASMATEREHRQPPPEAIEACQEMTADSNVSFVTPRGDTLEAKCKLINDQLVAVPINPPKHHKNPPCKESK